jgi:uncharacterized membrane protein YidH (DUF202 family)
LIAEMKAHTAGLTTLVGVMGTIIGICIGALATIAWRRLNKIEQRQEDLRDKTLPQLLTKGDMEAVVTALKEVGMAFSWTGSSASWRPAGTVSAPPPGCW